MSSQLRIDVLREARLDLKFLLERGYRRQSALRLVGDKYQLGRAERSLLFRSVIPESEAEVIRSKIIAPEKLAEERVLVDGFNALNTVEAMLRGEPLILCDDGVLRDIMETHSKYSPSHLTEDALKMILEFLKGARAAEVEVLYESQISKSGEIAGLTRHLLSEIGLRGGSRTEKTVDSILAKSSEVIATSDSAILLICRAFIDVPQSLAQAMGARIIRL
jgi:hypothetical protein